MICETYPTVVDKLIIIAWGLVSFLLGYYGRSKAKHAVLVSNEVNEK